MDRKISNILRHAEVSEKVIEKHLCDRVRDLGGVCLKYSSASMVGYPDRVALMPEGRTIWFELKSEGKKPTRIQTIRHEQMRKLGHMVFVCDSRDSVDNVLRGHGYEI